VFGRKVGGGSHAEFVGETGPSRLEHPQGATPVTRRVQRAHEQLHERFPKRVRRREALEFGDELGRVAGAQIRVDPLLQRIEAHLVEAHPGRSRELGIAGVDQRRTAPQVERPAQRGRRRRRIGP